MYCLVNSNLFILFRLTDSEGAISECSLDTAISNGKPFLSWSVPKLGKGRNGDNGTLLGEAMLGRGQIRKTKNIGKQTPWKLSGEALEKLF